MTLQICKPDSILPCGYRIIYTEKDTNSKRAKEVIKGWLRKGGVSFRIEEGEAKLLLGPTETKKLFDLNNIDTRI